METITTEKWGVFSDEDLRIIAKALAAYALKQAWGGSPRAEELHMEIIEFFINAGRKTP